MTRKPNKTDAVICDIRNQIICQKLVPGDRLMPLRELATHFNASRSVINQAIGTLAAKGYLEIKPRQYVKVRDFWMAGNLEVVNDVYYAPANPYKERAIEEMLMARKMAELTAIDQIAEMPKSDFFPLDDILEKEKGWLLSPSGDIGVITGLDSDFHENLVKLSGNRILSLLYLSFHRISTDLIGIYYKNVSDQAFSIKRHASFLTAIKKGDYGQARVIWSELLEKGRNVILQSES